MGQYSKFKLPIVSNQQLVSLLCNKSFSYFVSVFVKSGLVLKVRAAGGETACLGVDV